jgi:hypothetical protein
MVARCDEDGQRQPAVTGKPQTSSRAAELPARLSAIGDEPAQPPCLGRDFGPQTVTPEQQAPTGPQESLYRSVGKDHPRIGINQQDALQ